jgi:hypothetical protein
MSGLITFSHKRLEYNIIDCFSRFFLLLFGSCKGFMTLVILDGRYKIKQEGDAISSGTHSLSELLYMHAS